MKNYKATKVSVNPNGYLLMENGIWKTGTWNDGTWYNGTWEDGLWKDGVWETGTWKTGTWETGIWKSGTWEDGWILDPDRKGNFEKGWKWEGYYVRSPINPKEYFAEKKEKPSTKEETVSITGILEINGKKYRFTEVHEVF